jgi:hypothetical protein
MICGVHGKIEIEDISIKRTGKKSCKICSLERNKKQQILFKMNKLPEIISNRIIPNEKLCSKCKLIKLIDNFHKSNSSKDGHHTYCKECQKIYKKEYYSLPGVKLKFSKTCKRVFLKRVYSLSVEEYKTLKQNQNNLCKICNKPERAIDRRTKMLKELSVDHCHKTGKVRGLLCSNCNVGLGNFKDDIGVLIKAIKYLHENE